MMPCIDGCSGCTKVYLLSNNEVVTTLDAIKHYIALPEWQNGQKNSGLMKGWSSLII